MNNISKSSAFVKLSIPRAAAEIIMRVTHETTRHLLILLVARAYAERKERKPVPDKIVVRKPVSVHSKIVARIVGERNYREFTRVREALVEAQVITVDRDYTPRRDATDPERKQHTPPRCMKWTRNPRQNILYQRVAVPAAFVSSRVRDALRWYYDVYIPSIDPERAEACALAQEHLSLLDVPDDPDANLSHREPHVSHDWRLRHPATNLQRNIRDQCTFGGERIAMVDAHAMHICELAAIYARGEERKRLVEMVQTGRFYPLFAEMIGADREPGYDPADFKRRFLRDVLFRQAAIRDGVECKYLGGNDLWQDFRLRFPHTAKRLSNERDRGPITQTRRARNAAGHRYRRVTRAGQTAVSRRFTWVESLIFWKGAMLRLWREQSIPTLPFHDALLCRESDAKTVQAAIEEEAERVLGFKPVIKVTLGKATGKTAGGVTPCDAPVASRSDDGNAERAETGRRDG